LRYATSFFGVVDLLSIVPTYLAVAVPETQSFMVIRAIRLLRVFRILKAAQFLSEAQVLTTALRTSRRKITVFLGGIATVILIAGTLMYVIEGEEHGFSSIPRSMYWAVVTVTTVGYGDIAPHTPLGQLVASLLMILGYAIIAVPTGIVLGRAREGEPLRLAPGVSGLRRRRTRRRRLPLQVLRRASLTSTLISWPSAITKEMQ
jgi:voltage-gated potassium channel